jgi:hypothetical protein
VESVLEIVVGCAGGRALRRGGALQELRGVALAARLTCFARGALGRIAPDLALQFDDVEEDIGLAAQLVATMGGWVEIVETTVTRTPRRCMASTNERKSPSPENKTM